MTLETGNTSGKITSNQIYLSRDNIRNQIIEYLQYYLEIENVTLVKSSFLSFMVDTLATLTSNVLFYSSSTYKEFFLTNAQLPESIYNLSAFLGYNPKEANYSTVNALISVPLGFTESPSVFHIPENFKFKAGNIVFSTFYSTNVTITNNSSVSVVATQDNTKTYNLPVNIDSTAAQPEFSFMLPLRQYEKVVQEFQIDEDIQLYQFVTLDIPLSGKVSSLLVQIRTPLDPSEAWTTYNEFNSVYLMSVDDYGYVSRTTSSGRRLIFGNGLIGKQPIGGSTVKVTTYITHGQDGNIISSSLGQYDKIYINGSDGKTQMVNFRVTNPSSAAGGKDEESIQEIRSNSIANLVALKRLVSEYDYKNVDSIISDSSITGKTIPVLKRSDVKCNEIQLYSSISFGSNTRTSVLTGETITEDSIVPTRNAKFTIPMSTTYIPRESIITIDSVDYYTLFDISIDLINFSAYYNYIMYELDVVPILETSYGMVYDLVCSKLTCYVSGNDAIFELYYNSTEVDYEFCTAKLKILSTGLTYNMTNDVDNKRFITTFHPYTIFPEGNVNLELYIYTNSGASIAKYSTEIIFRKSLNDFMMSNIEVDTNSGITTIYDVPVIKKSYYDSIIKKDFELNSLQNLMNSLNFTSYRMLTDFINFKFVNTTGKMINMKYNPVTKNDCINIGMLTPPIAPTVGDRYIIGYTDSGEWSNKYGQIAECVDDVLVSWTYSNPISNDIIYVLEKDKKYIYNGNKWVTMEFQIPLIIDIEVFRSLDYYGSDEELANIVKESLLTEYSERFGPNITLYRSEIIRTVQNVTGVRHCNLVNPSCNIFFEYDLSTLTESELLEYGPEYIYFNQDSISVKVYM